MGLVEEYLKLANDVVSFRELIYDSATANKHNGKVKRMAAIAAEIEQNGPGLKNDFFQLLSHENNEVRLWVAHHMLECMHYDLPYRRKALKEIRRKARQDKTAQGLGEKVWLKNWYRQHPKDRWI